MADGSTRREFLAGTGRAALGLTLLPVARGSAAAPSDPEKRPPWRPLVAKLAKQLPRLMAEQKTPGLGIVLLRGGKMLWRGGFGVRDDVSKAPVDNDTVFEIASVSKTVFSYAVLKLCEKGVLALDAPLTKY